MNKEDLDKYKKNISELSLEESKQRDLYLKGLSDGTLQGPPVGYSSIDKQWLKNYSDDAIKKDIPEMTAFQFIYNENKNHLNEIALEYLGNQITYKELFNNIDKTAKSFKEKGVKCGDVVTMGMATTPEMVYILYALVRIGAVVNAIDPRLTEDEIKEKMKISGSKMFIGLDMCTSKVINFKDELKIKEVVEISPFTSASKLVKVLTFFKKSKNNKNIEKWKKFIEDGQKYEGTIDEQYESDRVVITLYTGGTTGPSKGVQLTNENLNTMAMTQVISDFNVSRGDSFLNFLPPFSAYSIVNAIHDPLYMGFKTTLIPQFKPSDFPKLMAKYKPNHVLSGPILWDLFMKNEKYNNIDLSFLKSPISGGDSMNAEFEKKVNDFLESRGCKYKVQQGYGMTEVSAAASYSSEKTYSEGSVGVPYVKNIIASFDPDTHDELSTNREGEIRISTPTMMKGYQNDQKATDRIITVDEDGKRWISTGDMGRIDENGNVYISGRIKRMIVRSGNKIFPLNIENVVMSLDEIDNISIVGMEDEVERHVPIAYIVINEEYVGQEEVVSQKIEDIISVNMPSYCVPVKFVYRNELPLTGMSKIDFKELEREAVNYIGTTEKNHIENKKTIKR